MNERLALPSGDGLPPTPPVAFLGREHELATLATVIDDARVGRGTAVVLHGERGIGKTALLEAIRERARGFDVVQLAGSAAEADLRHGVLDQLCRSLAAGFEQLPLARRATLRSTFAAPQTAPPDRLMVGASVLDLLREASTERPLLCLVDDTDRMDQASAAALAFAARRSVDAHVGLVFAAETMPTELRGLRDLRLSGLTDDAGRALLDAAVRRPLDARVRERVVAEARGNPAALMAAAGELAHAQSAGGFDSPDVMPRTLDAAEPVDRLRTLSEDSRMLLLIAAAEPTGDALLLWLAADLLGIPAAAADDAMATGLCSIAEHVRFRHPLLRGAIYRSATVQERRLAHGALAAAIDPEADPERHAWHSAREAAVPQEPIAASLERWARPAAERGGIAATAAFLRQAASLTPDPVHRGRRALAAATAAALAGDRRGASRVLATAEAAPLDVPTRTRVELARAGFSAAEAGGAARLGEVARQLAEVDVDASRRAHLVALSAIIALGDSSGAEPGVIARQALALAPSAAPTAAELLLDGLARQVLDGPSAAFTRLRRAIDAFASDGVAADITLDHGWLASYSAAIIWDQDAHRALALRHARAARAQGALGVAGSTLAELALVRVREGELAEAARLAADAAHVARATTSPQPVHLSLLVEGHRGGRRAVAAFDSATEHGWGLTGVRRAVAHHAAAVLYNGLGRYDDALAQAHASLLQPEPFLTPAWALPEMVEAAARSGASADAVAGLRRISTRARLSGTDFALGIEARAKALLAKGDDAESAYEEAIRRLSGCASPVDAARARLLYGEWLRRAGRRVDAREQLRPAHDQFVAMGMQAFAERTRRELRASGETARRRADDTREDLTAQERQIAELAREGLSNLEIGARLYLSPRTVEWHLRKVFAKLQLRSRRDLVQALPAREHELASA